MTNYLRNLYYVNKGRFVLIPILFILFSPLQSLADNCTVNAGIDRTVCANEPLILYGQQNGIFSINPVWTQVSGPSVVIETPGTLQTNVIGATGGNTYTFRLYATCGDGALTFQDVDITVTNYIDANAGADQLNKCPGNYNLAGNDPGGNTGAWTIIGSNNADISITNTSLFNSAYTLSTTNSGSTTLRWTITHAGSGCEDYDDVVIQNLGGVTPVNAGADINVNNCYSATTTATLDGTFAGSYGTWTVVSGPNVPTITNTHLRNTGISNLIQGTYVFRWTVAGPCVNGSDEVNVIVPAPAGSVSGASISPSNPFYCDGRTSVVLTGSQPNFALETVEWTQVTGHGGVVYSSTNNPSVTISGLNPANTYTFRYTIRNTSTGCSSTTTTTISYGVGPTINITNTSPILLTCGLSTATIAYTSSGAGGVSYSIISAPAGFGAVPTAYQSTGSPATVNNLTTEGTYVVRLRKESTGNGCDAAFDDITIMVSTGPTQANAGTDILVSCNTYTTGLAGNEPTDGGGKGIGSWSQVSGPNNAVFANIYNKNSGVTGLINGTYVFRWTINAGTECDASQDDVNVIVSSTDPKNADAGPDQNVCYGHPVTLSGNAPSVVEIGSWSVTKNGANPAPEVVFSNINAYNAVVTGLAANTVYTFTWFLNNDCNHTKTDNCNITTSNDQGPTTPNAGADQCIVAGTTTITLAGNSPTSGSGTWTKISGVGGSITTPSAYNSTVTGLSNGTYVFQWATSNDCITLTDQVTVTIGTVSSAVAGADQFLCEANSTSLAATAPAIGTGSWTQLIGPGGATFSSSTVHNPTVTGLVDGIYQFQWTVTNGGCSTSDIVKIYVSTTGITDPIANVLGSTEICGGNSVTMNANTIASGNGLWTIVSGPNTPTITNISSPTTTITGLVHGTYTFRWNAYGAAWCTSKTDDISVTVVQTANAGSDQNLCDVTSVNLTGNDGTTGTWSFTAKPGGAPDPTITPNPAGSNAAIASGLVAGTYTFKYTIAAIGGCGSTNDNMNVTIFSTSSAANITTANTEVCNAANFSLTADVPVSGTGIWSVLMGSGGSFTNASNASTTYTPTGYGTYIFRWTVTNGQCSSIDEVTIKNYAAPQPNPLDAGDPQSICGTTATMDADDPTIGVGAWSLVSRSGDSPAPTIGSTILYNTSITGLGTHSDGSDATYIFRWTVTNGVCVSVSDDVTITVKEIPTTANAGPDQSNHCANTTSFTLDGNTPIVGTGQWTKVSGPADAGSFSNNADPDAIYNNPVVGTYVFRWKITATHSTCTSEDEVTIVNYSDVDATGDAGLDQNICEYDGLALSAADPAPGTGTWSNVSGPTTPTILNPTSRNTNIVGTIPGTYVFRWTITNGSCSDSDDIQVIITAEPPMAIAGSDQEICNATSTVLNGNDPTPSTGKWTIVSSPGGAPTFNDDTDYNTTFDNLTVAGDYILKWTTGSGSCAKEDQVVITKHPDISVSDQPDDATICVGGTNTLSITAAGGDPGTPNSYLWQKSTGDETGPWSNVSGAVASSYSVPTNLTVGNHWYRCRVTDCAVVYSDPAQITVVADPTISDQPDASTICSGTTQTLTASATGGTGTYSYQWRSSLNGTNWTNVGAASADTPNNYTTAALTTTTYYSVVITQTGAGCNTLTSNSVRVFVPVISAQPGGGTICSGGIHTMNITTGSGGGSETYSYQWQKHNGVGWDNVGADSPSYTTANDLAIGTHRYQCVVSTAGAAVCTLTSNEAQVVVVADPTISDQPDNATICNGGSNTLSLTASGNVPPGTVTYQWQYSTSNSPYSWNNTGSNSNSLSTGVLTATRYYQCIITQSASGCSTTSDIATITVVSDPTVSTTDGTNLCSGVGTHTLTATVSNGIPASQTYNWQQSANGSNGWAIVTGGSGNGTLSYTTPTLTANTWYRIVVTDAGNGCADPNSTAKGVYIPTITSQPGGATICNGGTHTMSVSTDVTHGSMTYSYQWQWSATGLAGSWANVTDGSVDNSVSGTSSYTTAALSATTYYRCVVDPTSPDCNTIDSNSATVTVVADPTITDQPDDATICSGGTTTLSITASGNAGAGALSYQWQISTVAGPGYVWNNVSDGTVNNSVPGTSSYTTATLSATRYYRCVVTQPSSDCASIPSSVATVTINTVTSGSLTGNQTICYNTDPSEITTAVAAAGAGLITYQWQKSTTSALLGFSDIAVTTETYDAADAHTQDTWYRRIAKSTLNTVVCTATSAAVKITVEPYPTATPSTASQIICHNSVPTLTVDVTAINGHNYLVIAISNPGGVGGVSVAPYTRADAATIETGTLTNTTNTAQTVTYTIVPYTNGTNGTDNSGLGDDCLGTSFDVNLVVEPLPAATRSAASEIICSGSSPTITVDVTAVDGNKYLVQSISNTGSVTGVTGAPYTRNDGAIVDGGTLTNSNSTTQAVVYTIRPYTYGLNGIDNSGTGDDCLGTSFTVTVNVEPTPSATRSTASEIICNNTSPTATVDVTAVNGNRYLVSSISNPGSVGNVSAAPYTRADGATIDPNVLANPGSANGTVTYTFRPYNYGPNGIDNSGGGDDCLGATSTIAVTVQPTPSATPSAVSQRICHNSSPTLTVDVTALDGNQYRVTAINNPGGVGGVTAAPYSRNDGATINSGTFTNVTASPQTVTFTVRPYNYGPNNTNDNGGGDDCLGTPFDVDVIVDNLVTANAGPDQSLYEMTSFTMAGNTPALGSGVWTQRTALAGTITTSGSPTTTITNTVPGSYTFRWTITNGACVHFDEMDVNNTLQPSISITDDAKAEGTTLSHTVTLSNASGQSITVDYATSDGAAPSATIADNDYNSTSGTLVFSPGETSKTINVTTNNDTHYEQNEKIHVDLTNPTHASIADLLGVGTINDNDSPIPSISITDDVRAEGTDLIFTVSLSKRSYQTITVQYSTTDGTATLANNDYTSIGLTTLTFNPGETSKTVTVHTTSDTNPEPDETINVDLSNVSATATIFDPQGIGTITNNDTPFINISDDTRIEGESLIFTATLTGPSSLPITIMYETRDLTAMVGDGDYSPISGATLSFAPGETSKTITVPTTNDINREESETMNVILSSPVNVIINDGTGLGRIVDNDPQPTISITDDIKLEGRILEFTVSLSHRSYETIRVDYKTSDGTALLSDNDYTSLPLTTLVFSPGQTSKKVFVTTLDDLKLELTETVNVDLSSSQYASIEDSRGVGTITDNDLQPTIRISDDTKVEGNSLVFTVSLSNGSSEVVTVVYRTNDGTARAADGDYSAINSTTLTFAPGELSKTVTVTTNNDNRYELSETITVDLSTPTNATIADAQGVGTITDDDVRPTISISDDTKVEGNSLVFTVTLSNASGETVTVVYRTNDGTARVSNGDYTTIGSTILTFAPGETSKTITVVTNDDNQYENTETLTVDLSSATNATIADPQGIGIITDNDARPTISISDDTKVEGNNLVFTVSLSHASTETITVAYRTNDGTATIADGDYTAIGLTTLTFAPGETTKTVTVITNNDTRYELSETITVNLSSPTNATIADGQGLGTITDNDGQPTISITDDTKMEGLSLIFTVSLNNPSSSTVTVKYITNDGTATVTNSDYTPIGSTTITFLPGEITKTVTVYTTHDIKVEPDETITVDLSQAVGASIADAQGVGTILNNDHPPVVADIHKTGPEDEDIRFTSSDFISKYSDEDGDPMVKMMILSLPANGILKLNGVPVTINMELTPSQLGNLVFTPNSNWFGDTQFDWKAYDGANWALVPEQVFINIYPVNDPPVARDDVNTTPKNIPVGANVLTNDSDIDGGDLTVTQFVIQGVTYPAGSVATIPGIGTLVIRADGTYTFTPAHDYVGPVPTARYTNIDGKGGTASANLDITVTPVNNPPVAVIDRYTTTINKPVTNILLINDSDPDGDVITINTSPIDLPNHGTVVINLNGSFIYTPMNGYVGTDEFIYRICDNGVPMMCDTAIVKITITNPDTDGDCVPDYLEDLNHDGNYGNDDTDNDGIPNYLDADDDGDGIPTNQENEGSACNPVSFDLDHDGIPNYLDWDDDNDGIGTRRELKDLNGNGIPDYLETYTPEAIDDCPNRTGVDAPIIIYVLDNDSTVMLPEKITIVTPPNHGKVTVNTTTGAATYTPDYNYVGEDEFIYRVCNVYDQCDNAKVCITIADVIEPPQILTPNGDGENDTFIIPNINIYERKHIIIFNRWGNKVYESNNYLNEWDGTSNQKKFGDKPLPVGTYFYILEYGIDQSKTGYVYLDR